MQKINGIIKSISETIQISDKFRKRDFVLTTDHTTNWPQFIQLELTQDKCFLIDNYKIDDEISVDFNVRGRQWTDKEGKVKKFNSLQVWKIELVNPVIGTASENPAILNIEPTNDNTHPIVNVEQNDDLPF